MQGGLRVREREDFLRGCEDGGRCCCGEDGELAASGCVDGAPAFGLISKIDDVALAEKVGCPSLAAVWGV